MDASTQSTELTGSFTAAAWDRIAPIMAEIEALPLLTRLSDGTLPPEIFRHSCRTYCRLSSHREPFGTIVPIRMRTTLCAWTQGLVPIASNASVIATRTADLIGVSFRERRTCRPRGEVDRRAPPATALGAAPTH